MTETATQNAEVSPGFKSLSAQDRLNFRSRIDKTLGNEDSNSEYGLLIAEGIFWYTQDKTLRILTEAEAIETGLIEEGSISQPLSMTEPNGNEELDALFS